MTLCISAEALHKNEKWAVVNCCDSREEKGGLFQELIGSDSATKIHSYNTTRGMFTALLSGIPTRCYDLMADSRDAIADFDALPGGVDFDLEISTFLEALRNGAAKRKKKILNHHLEMGLGISLEDFLRTAKDKFTPDHYNQLWSEIRDVDLGADLIFSGIHNDTSCIVRLDRAGQSHWENNYSVIGIGSDIALVVLGQRDYDSYSIGLSECIYRVFEAKRAV